MSVKRSGNDQSQVGKFNDARKEVAVFCDRSRLLLLRGVLSSGSNVLSKPERQRYAGTIALPYRR